MTLQNFQPKARITGDKMDLRNYFGRPLLVRVTEFVPDFTSQSFPTPKPVVFADVVDLVSGQIFINCLWGGGAVVDNLKEHAGTDVVLPLMAQNATGGSGRNYIALTALDDATAAAAGQWYQQNWGTVEQTRQQRMAAAQAAQPAPQQNQFQQAAPQQQQGFAPVQGGFGQQFAPVQHQTPAPARDLHGDGSVMVTQPGGQGYQPPAGQTQQFNQAQGFGQPAQAPAGQQFQQPGTGQAPQGMFSDQMPPAQQGQGFAAPQGTDPAAAQQALQQLNGQLGG